MPAAISSAPSIEDAELLTQPLLATPLSKATWPPDVARATNPPDQDIALNKIKINAEFDPRRVLAYMYNVTKLWKKAVRDFMPRIARMSPEEIVISEDFAVNQRDLKRLAKNFPPQTFASQWWSMTVGRPLETLGEILHSCYPNEMRAFDMYRAQFPGDVEQGLSMYTWSSSMIDEHASRNKRRVGNMSADSIPNIATPSTDVRCCVFVLEPWAVNDFDFNAFTKQRVMRNRVNHRGVEMLHPTPGDKIWAMIHDRCSRLKCNWFVVTTHDNWAFGCLSKARTVGFITDPLRHDSTEPTVMESLVYWIMSSMGADNSWKIDEVSKRSERLLQKQGKIPRDTDPVFLSPFSSVSPSVSSSPTPPPPSIPIPAPRRTSPRVTVTRSSRQTPEIIYTKQQLESIRSSKRQRQIEDEIKRDMKRDRADDGAWQPKVPNESASTAASRPPRIPGPVTIFKDVYDSEIDSSVSDFNRKLEHLVEKAQSHSRHLPLARSQRDPFTPPPSSLRNQHLDAHKQNAPLRPTNVEAARGWDAASNGTALPHRNHSRSQQRRVPVLFGLDDTVPTHSQDAEELAEAAEVQQVLSFEQLRSVEKRLRDQPLAPSPQLEKFFSAEGGATPAIQEGEMTREQWEQQCRERGVRISSWCTNVPTGRAPTEISVHSTSSYASCAPYISVANDGTVRRLWGDKDAPKVDGHQSGGAGPSMTREQRLAQVVLARLTTSDLTA